MLSSFENFGFKEKWKIFRFGKLLNVEMSEKFSVLVNFLEVLRPRITRIYTNLLIAKIQAAELRFQV